MDESTEVRYRRSGVANVHRLRVFCPVHLSGTTCRNVLQEDAEETSRNTHHKDASRRMSDAFFLVRWNYAGKISLSNCIGASVRQWIPAVFLLLIILDRWLDSASHRDCSIIFMYRNIEIVTQQEPPTSCTLDASRRMSDAFFERSPGNAEWARERLRHRFRVIIRELDTVHTVRGGSAMSRKMHGGEVLARSSCAGLARVLFVLVVSIAMFRLGGFYSEMSQTRKKEEALRRVLLLICCVQESLQSTCHFNPRKQHSAECDLMLRCRCIVGIQDVHFDPRRQHFAECDDLKA